MNRGQHDLPQGDSLRLAEMSHQAPIEDRQTIVVRVQQVSRVRVAVKHRPMGTREHRLSQQRSRDQSCQGAVCRRGIERMIGDLLAEDALHRRHARRAMLVERGNLHVWLVRIKRLRFRQMQLFLVQPHLDAQFGADVIERFAIVEVRDRELVAARIEIRADLPKQIQLQLHAIFNSRLENLEHALAGRRIAIVSDTESRPRRWPRRWRAAAR